MDRMLELENTDSKPWSWLEPIAILKTQVRVCVPKDEQKKLKWRHKILKLLCG